MHHFHPAFSKPKMGSDTQCTISRGEGNPCAAGTTRQKPGTEVSDPICAGTEVSDPIFGVAAGGRYRLKVKITHG